MSDKWQLIIEVGGAVLSGLIILAGLLGAAVWYSTKKVQQLANQEMTERDAGQLLTLYQSLATGYQSLYNLERETRLAENARFERKIRRLSRRVRELERRLERPNDTA